MSEMLDKVNYAIIRAFFSRPIEEQIFNVSPADNEDLAKAVLETIEIDNVIISKEEWCKLKASNSVFNALTK